MTRTRRLLAACALAALVAPALAAAATRVGDPRQGSLHEGVLAGEPAVFAFALAERSLVGVTVAVPEGAPQDVSARLARADGRLVADLAAERAGWDTTFADPETGETYRVGSGVTATLEPGEYVVEVTSPDEDGPYALRFEGDLPQVSAPSKDEGRGLALLAVAGLLALAAAYHAQQARRRRKAR